jgi:hypothetical protein
VVIAASPRNPRHIICKRVLGLEGDTIRVPVASAHGARTVTARTVISVSCLKSCWMARFGLYTKLYGCSSVLGWPQHCTASGHRRNGRLS